ncbi:hypothetical protein IMG5_127890 [Ichthyophthirius multifiliis]|uniref:Transmembrane protein n=1 Tax=Ichthyophthirius multifiliis TaxID=5932 RepID=G0QVZ3_ICHMU|nr:hypothetical protein IMG5_127890 [Ichthyophthirius multifiliis]EGR30609.1 hypothetical protein IMG5_127890 [Ichthyophthirius multifiliis]|eukprot:XP_004032196.1 hypothetical protein IMG5_127890 [Ichthyophthirius multifiliis]
MIRIFNKAHQSIFWIVIVLKYLITFYLSITPILFAFAFLKFYINKKIKITQKFLNLYIKLDYQIQLQKVHFLREKAKDLNKQSKISILEIQIINIMQCNLQKNIPYQSLYLILKKHFHQRCHLFIICHLSNLKLIQLYQFLFLILIIQTLYVIELFRFMNPLLVFLQLKYHYVMEQILYNYFFKCL